MTDEAGETGRRPPPGLVRATLLGAPWALLVGAGSSAVYLGISELEDLMHDVWWDHVPDALGVSAGGAWWSFAVLSLTGLLVGLIIRYVPGHAGPDPATEGLIAPPMSVAAVPSLLAVAVLGLAGGVSLGPENPVTAANIALAWWLGSYLMRRAGRTGEPALWVALGAAGTVGALFGTPVAAALILSEVAVGKSGTPLWDRLMLPLLAAGAGAATTKLIEAPDFSVPVPPYRGFELVDLVSGSIIVLAAVALGLAGSWAFPYAHAAFRRLRNPVLTVTAGGVLLGALGALAGQITMFKGLDEVRELTQTLDEHSNAELLMYAVVKMVAIVIAGTCGFRGGRIFPAVFTGAALGCLATGLVDAVPLALAIGCGVLGLVLAVTRQGWLSLFVGVAIVADLSLLPVLCILVVPGWLLCAGRPPMIVTPRSSPGAGTPGPPGGTPGPSGGGTPGPPAGEGPRSPAGDGPRSPVRPGEG